MSARRERGQGNPAQTPETNGLNLSELKEKTIGDLNQIARDLNVQNIGGLRKQELIFKILQSQAEKVGLIYLEDALGVDEPVLLRLRLEDLEYQLLLAQATDVLDVQVTGDLVQVPDRLFLQLGEVQTVRFRGLRRVSLTSLSAGTHQRAPGAASRGRGLVSWL